MEYTAAQQEAIETIDRNLQIIACAGSGKTQVISARIAPFPFHVRPHAFRVIMSIEGGKEGLTGMIEHV
jgi:hypothetical protein